MKIQLIESWLLLLYFDWLMAFRGFADLYATVRTTPVGSLRKPEKEAELSRMVDLACVFYFKQVFCLQRSAALAVLLRRHGIRGELVIGVQPFPFASHAWVEVAGQVINDKPYVGRVFQPLERC